MGSPAKLRVQCLTETWSNQYTAAGQAQSLEDEHFLVQADTTLSLFLALMHSALPK